VYAPTSFMAYGVSVFPASLNATLALATPPLIVARSVMIFSVLAFLAAVIFGAIRFLAGEKSRKLGPRKYWFLGADVLAIVALYLLRKPVGTVLTGIAAGLVRLMPIVKWDLFLTGLYDTLIATLFLVLLIQVVGELYWFNAGRLDRWRRRKAAEAAHRGTVHEYLYRSLLLLNRLFRAGAIVALLLIFFPVVFHLFPLTRTGMLAIEAYLQSPARTVGVAMLDYLPNLGYLIVIAVLGWASLKIFRFIFDSIKTDRLVVRGFQQDWAEPTYKLLRALFLLFLLMVSFPHLPGASSEFFKGFSVFIGALVTFGSAGAVNNLVSGIVLTYTSAFRVDEMVRIGETTGIVLEKTLLVTRIRTLRNEEVSLPNSTVLSTSIVNFARRAASGGLALSVNAGIGYDVDWRTVHALMIDGAKKTEHILAEPPPVVLQTELGDYAVNYQLLAWTDRAEIMVLINSELRRNVLDCFNAAGVEIMTPSVLAHRDASEAAIPPERMQQAVAPKRITVDIHNSAREVSHSERR
jgi:small-conductance mechanosensitive channel